MASEPVKVVIVTEGGRVQSVINRGVPLEVVIVDYDTDGQDSDIVKTIDGERAAIYYFDTEPARPILRQGF